MLRTKITKPISQDKEILLMTNHNFFIRTAIVCVAKNVIASVIFLSLYEVSTVVFNNIVIKIRTPSKAENFHNMYHIWIFIIAVNFLAYFCYEIYKIIKTHKEVTEIENGILGKK